MKRKTKKYLKITAGSILGMAALLFIVLVVHIAIMVKGRSPIVNPTVQMARVDFRHPLDSADIAKVQNRVKAVNGVRSSFFNSRTNILIYTFDNQTTDANNIYNHAVKNLKFDSERYRVSASDLKKGCPAMNGNSFYGQLTSLVAKVVN